MELVSQLVPTTKSIALKGVDEAVILPISDIQLDPALPGRARAVDIERLKRTVQWGLDHGARFIGVGDYVDVASPSNREAIKHAKLYDNVSLALEKAAKESQDELHDIFSRTRGQWLGVLSGHHYWDYEDGTNTDTKFASYLEAPYLGSSTLTTVRFDAKGKHAAPAFKIFAHHGQGGGRALTSGLNSLVPLLGTFDADVFMVAHHHKADATKVPFLSSIGGEKGRPPKLMHRDRLLLTTGSYLKGWMQGSKRGGIAGGLYPEVGMMRPLSLGTIVIMARPRYDDGYATVDLDFMSL